MLANELLTLLNNDVTDNLFFNYLSNITTIEVIIPKSRGNTLVVS